MISCASLVHPRFSLRVRYPSTEHGPSGIDCGRLLETSVPSNKPQDAHLGILMVLRKDKNFNLIDTFLKMCHQTQCVDVNNFYEAVFISIDSSACVLMAILLRKFQ